MSDGFLHQFVKDYGNEPGWLRGIRQNALDRFAALGFPNRQQEAWRYTNLDPIQQTAFKSVDFSSPGVIKTVQLAELMGDTIAAQRLVFVNGHYASELSLVKGLPDGVIFGNLSDMILSHPKLLEESLTHYAPYQEQSLVALNTAFLRDGAFVYIPKGMVLAQPLELIYVSSLDGAGIAGVSYPRNLIVVGDEAQVTVVERYVGVARDPYLTNAVTEMVGGAGAHIDHYKIQQEGKLAFHLGSLQVRQGRDCHFSSHAITLGGKLSRNDVTTVLSDQGCDTTLNGLYLVGGQQHADSQTSIDHACPHGTSRELYKGILSDQATGVFNGRIIVRPDAQKTSARQSNKNLLLSDEAQVNTKPVLEIYANDVKCNHGATIGRLDEQQLFYLRSRGLGEPEAKGLLTYAFASDVVDSIKVETLRNRLKEWLFVRLAGQGKLEAA